MFFFFLVVLVCLPLRQILILQQLNDCVKMFFFQYDWKSKVTSTIVDVVDVPESKKSLSSLYSLA